MNDEGIASEVSQEVSTEETRLMIPKIVCENFKSYAGIRELGPFHKVCTYARYSLIVNILGVVLHMVMMSKYWTTLHNGMISEC